MCNGHHIPSPPRLGVLYLSFATLIACTRGEVALHVRANAVNRGSTSLADDLYLAASTINLDTARLRGLQALRHDCENGISAYHDCNDEDHDHDDDDHDHDHDHAHHHELTWQRSLHVVGAALAMMMVSLVGVALPNILAYWGAKKSSTTRALIETLCTAFAAGGFWGLALIHMLLEAVTALQSQGVGFFLGTEQNFFNAAYILAAAGYMLMLGVQNFAVVLNAKAHRHHGDQRQSEKVALMDAAVSTIALTFHAFFEGLVCGMRDDATLIWVAAVSVMGHKWAESFSLAQRMRSSGVPRRERIIFLTIFLLASPVGALIGLPLSAIDNYATVGVLNSISAGILIFVAGHCTEDVFGGHCHSHHLVITCEADQALTDENKAGAAKSPPDVIVHAHAERETHTHGHGPSHCTEEPDFSCSILVFLGRMTCCVLGATLVAGMMCVHMSHSAHSHAIE